MVRHARSICSLIVACYLAAIISKPAMGQSPIHNGELIPGTSAMWGALIIDVPEGVAGFPIPYVLMQPGYVFFEDWRATLTVHISDPQALNWFSAAEIAKSRKIVINGMPSWQEESGVYTRISVKLPKPAGCSVQIYALLVFVSGDADAERMASSIRPKRPFPCLSMT